MAKIQLLYPDPPPCMCRPDPKREGVISDACPLHNKYEFRRRVLAFIDAVHPPHDPVQGSGR